MHRTIAPSHINNLHLFNSISQEGGDSPASYQQKCWDTGGGRGGSSR